MKKFIYFFAFILILLTFVLNLIYSQDDLVVVDNDVFKKPQRPRAVFKHNEHNKNAKINRCNTCHHVYKNGKFLKNDSSIGFRCSDCHELKSVRKMPNLRKAFHLNCKGCHKRKKTGPLMCGNCHCY